MDVGSAGLAAAKAAGEIAKGIGGDKIAGVLGSTFPFWGLKRRAVETYVKDIEDSNLPPETKAMMIINTRKTFREMKNQMAIAEVAQSVAREGTDFSDASAVDESWISRLMDAGKHVSDEEVQVLWGNVLAGEFEQPGSTPPSVIRILSEITPAYAKVFSKLCSLHVVAFPADGSGEPCKASQLLIVPLSKNEQFFNRLGITFQSLSELVQLGLIQYEELTPFIQTYSKSSTPIIHILYGADVLSCTSYPDRAFPIGNVLLTNAGISVSRFIAKETISGYFTVLSSYLESKPEVVLAETPMISIWQEATGTGRESSYRYALIEPQQTPEPQ